MRALAESALQSLRPALSPPPTGRIHRRPLLYRVAGCRVRASTTMRELKPCLTLVAVRQPPAYTAPPKLQQPLRPPPRQSIAQAAINTSSINRLLAAAAWLPHRQPSAAGPQCGDRAPLNQTKQNPKTSDRAPPNRELSQAAAPRPPLPLHLPSQAGPVAWVSYIAQPRHQRKLQPGLRLGLAPFGTQ